MKILRTVALVMLAGLTVFSQGAPPSDAKPANDDTQNMWDEYKIPNAWKVFLNSFVGSYLKNNVAMATLYKSEKSKKYIILIMDDLNSVLKYKKMYIYEPDKTNSPIFNNLPVPTKDKTLTYENEKYREIEFIFFDNITLQ